MPYAQVQHATIHYVTLPESAAVPEGMPVLTLVHGGGGNCYSFYNQMHFFAKHGFFVIAISVRGWGMSRLERDHPDDCASHHFASDVLAVLDAVGASKTAVVGHSIGGFFVTRMAVEAPERLTCAVMSSTFYGLVDSRVDGETPYLTQYVLHRQDNPWTVCDNLPHEIKAGLPAGSLGADHYSRSPSEGRPAHPDRPPNFSANFCAAQPERAWLYDSMRDGNEQVLRLKLNSLFRVMHHEGSVTPSELRDVWKGPLLFTVTECDALVHWETVALVAGQVAAHAPDATTRMYWLEGELYHAPLAEDPEQYNRVLLAFLRGEDVDSVQGGKRQRLVNNWPGQGEPGKGQGQFPPQGQRQFPPHLQGQNPFPAQPRQGPLPPAHPDRHGQRPGDWQCPSCFVNVFSTRKECFRCKTPRPLSAAFVDPRQQQQQMQQQSMHHQQQMQQQQHRPPNYFGHNVFPR